MDCLRRSRVEIPTKRLLSWVLLLGLLSSLAMAQDTGNSTPTNAAQTAPTEAAKPAPSSAPSAPAKSAPGVNPDSYIIGAEDTLSISVWKEPEMSRTVPVRPDGMISLPLIGEVKADGRTPVQLQDIIAESMKKIISDPQVTVIVEKATSATFNVVGEVGRPGSFPLTRRTTVLDAIGMAGGFKDFAKTKKVYILRRAANGNEERLRFNYKDVISGKNPQENIELQPRDLIVVP